MATVKVKIFENAFVLDIESMTQIERRILIKHLLVKEAGLSYKDLENCAFMFFEKLPNELVIKIDLKKKKSFFERLSEFF